MRLSFSIQNWNKYDWNELCAAAKDVKLQGVEMYDVNGPMFAGKSSPANPELAAVTRRALVNQGLSVPCVDTVADLTGPEFPRELQECLELAVNLGIDFIGVHTDNDNQSACAERLSQVLEQVGDKPVSLLIETTGAYADSAKLRDLLNHFADDRLGATWNMHSTYVCNDEDAEATITNLGEYVRHVHIHDFRKEGGASVPELIGEGALPIKDMMNALRSVNYDGFISLQWNPAWLDQLDDLEIILTHFASCMGRFESTRLNRKQLYWNNAHTGNYVWKKETLIEKTFPQVLDTMVEEFPDQLAVKFTTLDYTRTYSQFRDDVDEFARALVALGVRPGKKVTIWATNVPQWYLTFWAATKIGAILVTMNTAYKIHEAEYLLRQSDTHTLVMIEGYRDSNYNQIVNELCPELKDVKPGQQLHAKRLPFLRNVITVGFRMPGAMTWEDSLEYAPRTPIEEIRRMAAAVDVNDVCNMQYTSGTTGFPKGVMLTHYNIVNDGKMIGDGMDLSTADRMMIQVPMFHCFGMVLAMTATMTHGGTILPIPYFSPKSSLACINNEHITAFHGVPTMFIAMLAHEDFPKTDFSHMRTGRKPLPHRRNARRGGEDAHARDRHRLRPDRGVPRLHHEPHHRPAGGARGHRRLGLPGGRVQDRGPGDRRGLPRRGDRRVRGPGLQHHEGLLQDAQGHRRRHRQGRLAAHRRPGLPHARGQLPHHRTLEGHDHPRRREHLPQGDRGIHLHPSQGFGRAGHRRARQGHGRGDHGLHHPQGGRDHDRRGDEGLRARPHGQAQGAQVHRLRGRLPDERRRKDTEVQDARTGRGKAGLAEGRGDRDGVKRVWSVESGVWS